jgi:hypothetical protein
MYDWWQFHLKKALAPTSVASKRAFSVSGSFVSRRRKGLSNEAIDDLCFLKGYSTTRHSYLQMAKE